MKKIYSIAIAILSCVCMSAQMRIWVDGYVKYRIPLDQIDSITFIKASEQAEPIGALTGKFSVSQDKQVMFSQGNLQHNPATNVWRFADRQYDIIGSANGKLSPTYNGWLDMFGWGTGNYATLASNNSSHFGFYTEWGSNPIANGGNEANVWRALTRDEWGYLFNDRENAEILFGLGRVENVKGMIILPDNWVLPNGVSFVASTTQGLAHEGKYYFTSGVDGYTHNVYTADEWTIMEANGAVFLPAAGHRSSKSVGGVNGEGDYWSSTGDRDDGSSSIYAHYLSFTTNSVTPMNKHDNYYGRAVRLVRVVK